jgi:hypothetical protein
MSSPRHFPPPWTVEELIFAVPSVTAFLMTIFTLASWRGQRMSLIDVNNAQPDERLNGVNYR